jgi:hypothetical protein
MPLEPEAPSAFSANRKLARNGLLGSAKVGSGRIVANPDAALNLGNAR